MSQGTQVTLLLQQFKAEARREPALEKFYSLTTSENEAGDVSFLIQYASF